MSDKEKERDQEERDEREVRGISPLMQSQLMSQIQEVRQGLNNGDLGMAYRAVKVLILISPPKVKDNGTLKMLKELDDELIQAQKVKGADLKQRRERRAKAVTQVFRKRVIPLFEKTMMELYKGNYMEFYARDVDTNIPKHLLDKAMQQS